jgi:penicillin-binding protein 2
MNNPRNDKYRHQILRVIVYAVFAFFGCTAAYLQLIEGNSYIDKAEQGYIRYVISYPPRGEVFDRNGEYLIQNKICYDLMVVPRDASRKGIDTVRLAAITGEPIKRLKISLNESRKNWRTASTVVKYLSAEAKLKMDEWNLAGFYTVPRTVRQYPRNIGGNLLGSLAEVTQKVLDKYNKDGYYIRGDYRGEQGLELSYEKILRGEKGRIRRNLFADHSTTDEVEKEAVAGKNIVCSIDARLQAFAEELMEGKIGSVVAIEPSTGEILVMASSPTFDPNELVIQRGRGNHYMNLLNNPRRPLINRAVASPQPPGSTFKLLNGLIGLQEGVLKPHYCYSCNKGYRAGNVKMGCHEHRSPLDLDYAIATSCNAYFCNVYRNILENKKYASSKEGYEVWRNYVEEFGFGVRLGTDITGESRGTLYHRDYYDKLYRRSWNALTVLSVSIGQGEILATSLQLANFAAIIANRGYYYTPHIVKQIEGQDSIDIKYRTPHYTSIDRKHFETIISGMWRGVNRDGTCQAAKLPGFDVCGKTGTAQNPLGDDHSTFISFAPRKNPKIAIAVYVEHGVWGATAAVPIATLIEEMYLTDTITRPWLVEHVKNLNLDYSIYDRRKKK